MVRLAFGKRGLPVELPEGFCYRVLEARSAKPLSDADAVLERAVASPIRLPAAGRTGARKAQHGDFGL